MRLFTETWLSTGIRRACVSSILLGAALLTPPAIAQTTGLIDATKPERILEFAKSFGTAELEHEKSGDPRITGRMEGKRYTISFYGCKQNVNCTDIQFWAYWPASQSPGLPAINTWHEKKKFGTA